MGEFSSMKSKYRNELTDLVFSWSVDDILDENLYKDQVFLFLVFSYCSYFLFKEIVFSLSSCSDV